MGIRDIADRLKHTRIVKAESTGHEKKAHEEQERKYQEKSKWHSSHNQDKPKQESAKEKVLKSVMSHGKKFVEKSRQRAKEEALRQSKKSKKPKLLLPCSMSILLTIRFVEVPTKVSVPPKIAAKDNGINNLPGLIKVLFLMVEISVATTAVLLINAEAKAE